MEKDKKEKFLEIVKMFFKENEVLNWYFKSSDYNYDKSSFRIYRKIGNKEYEIHIKEDIFTYFIDLDKNDKNDKNDN